MVLERLFPEEWLERKIRYAFVISIIYSTLGIIAARLLFGANSGIVSVVFTSLFILPYLQKMFSKEEHEEEKESTFSIFKPKSIWSFMKRNQAVRVYLGIFLGIYLTYAAYSFFLPQLGINTFSIFKEQLFVDPALRGRAFDSGTFLSILTNNWWVLLACFLLSLVTGDGAIFFITWNASSWGALFGYRALSAAGVTGESALLYLMLILLITFPHVLIEGAAYIFAAISGSVVSTEIVKERQDVRNFTLYSVLCAGAVILLKFILRISFGKFEPVVFGLASIVLVTGIIHIIIRLFQQKRLQKVFMNNYHLFILAIILFILGAIIETLVLQNSATLNKIYTLSFMAGQ